MAPSNIFKDMFLFKHNHVPLSLRQTVINTHRNGEKSRLSDIVSCSLLDHPYTEHKDTVHLNY